jgi:hypothetical protein
MSLDPASHSTNLTPCGVTVPSPKPTPLSLVASGAAVVVSGIDLTPYLIYAPSQDTPFERFLKDEDRLGRLASSPWVARIHKL